MRHAQPAVTARRRQQIVEAAVAVITEQGLHHLSLSEIEKKAGMSRGQLTYYFRTKEDILLAVFDHVLQMSYRRMSRDGGMPEPPEGGCHHEGDCPGELGSWELIALLFKALLVRPGPDPDFNTLQYTFLSQVGYREDFRQRLAALYEEWRGNMARGLGVDAERGALGRAVEPRLMATLVQAMLHGLVMQSAVDPGAFDGEQMLKLCLDVLGTYLGAGDGPGRQRAARKSPRPTNGRRKRDAADPATRG